MSARDFVEKDYYAALGVPKEATAPEIKKAYRKLASELHPDRNPAGADRFKEVSEANDVLSDPTKRKEYDEARALFGSGGLRGQGGGGFDVGDLFGQARNGGFSDVFSGLFGGNGRRQAPRRGPDIEAAITISFADSLLGAAVPLRLSTRGSCAPCHGSGAAPGTAPVTCTACQGLGVISRNQGSFSFAEPCRSCRGTGRTVTTPCPTCQGSGEQNKERTVTAGVPAGVADGQKIRLKGKGSPGDSGAPAGDLIITVGVTPHPVFGRKGNHVTLTLPVTFAEAALGANIQVPTTDGTVTLKVPPGTRSGRTFRVKGRGFPSKSGVGDLLVTVEVDVPHVLSTQERAALESYAAVSQHDPRQHLKEVIL